MPEPKSYSQDDQPKLLIPKGPCTGEDLALVGGLTPQLIGRNASKKLWTLDEIKAHMLSPKSKNKAGKEPRVDFSPVRKALFKGNTLLCFCLSVLEVCRTQYLHLIFVRHLKESFFELAGLNSVDPIIALKLTRSDFCF